MCICFRYKYYETSKYRTLSVTETLSTICKCPLLEVKKNWYFRFLINVRYLEVLVKRGFTVRVIKKKKKYQTYIRSSIHKRRSNNEILTQSVRMVYNLPVI